MIPDRNISKWNISRSNIKKCWCRHYYLVEHVEELLRQAEQEAGKKHGLDVRDELRLAHQTVQTRALLQTLTHTQAVTLQKMKVRNQYWNWLSTALGSCLFRIIYCVLLHYIDINRYKYTIRSIICEAFCQLIVRRSSGHPVIWSSGLWSSGHLVIRSSCHPIIFNITTD